MSSLANQLQSIASLDASRLTHRTGAPSSKSYLFPAKQASRHDLDAIYALGQSGFEELVAVDEGMAEFEEELFSEHARRTDRMLLNKQQNEELDAVLGRCLRRLGKWLGTMAGGKCIEWLVRRFRVHEMSPENMLLSFLPYHSSPNFARMLAILTIPNNSAYHAPFEALIKNAQPVPRDYIVAAISPSRDRSLRLLEDVLALLPRAIAEGVVHRPLLAFWSAACVELIEKEGRGKGAEGLVKLLVESFVRILETTQTGVEVNAAVYSPLILLTRTIRLADSPFLALTSSLLNPESGADAAQRILTLLVLLNDRKGWSRGLGEDGPERISRIHLFGQIALAAMEKYGFADALRVVLSVMADRPELNQAHLSVFLNSSTISPSLAKVLASKLLSVGSASTSSDTVRQVCKSLLTNFRERHPTVVDSAFLEAAGRGASAAGLLDARQQQTSGFVDVVSADVSTRVKGVKAMFAAATSIDESAEDDRSAAREAIVARLGDDSTDVIHALHAQPEQLLEITGGATVYIAAVEPHFTRAARNLKNLRIILQFVITHIVPQSSEAQLQAFDRLLAPVLISSAQGNSVLIQLKAMSDSLAKFELLHSVQELLQGHMDATQFNERLSGLVATSVLSSAHAKEYLDLLVQRLESPNAETRMLAHLVLAQVLRARTASAYIATACNILRYLQRELQPSTSTINEKDVEMPFAKSYLDAVVKQTAKPSTTQRAMLSLLAASASVAKPAKAAADWMSDADVSAGNRWTAFSSLLYVTLNTSAVPSASAIPLLRALFRQVGDDILILLASIWSADRPAYLRLAALKHAIAFVRASARAGSEDKVFNFQMVMPALLSVLSSPVKEVREAAVELAKALPISGKGPIYAVDTFYGAKTEKVQLLKSGDLRRYLTLLREASDDLALDPARLAAIHLAALSAAQKQTNMSSSHRRSILSFLLSHVGALRTYDQRAAVLAALNGIEEVALWRGVLPLLQPLLQADSEESTWMATLPKGQQADWLRSLTLALGSSSAAALAEEEEGWTFLLSVLRYSETEGANRSQIRALVLQRLQAGLFERLETSQKVEILTALFATLDAAPTDEALALRPYVAKLPLDDAALVAVIHQLLEPLDSRPKGKRPRSEAVDEGAAESGVDHLTILLESRDWAKMAPTPALLAVLMSTLSTLLSKRASIKDGVDYLEQEVLGAVLALLQRIKDEREVQKAQVGIEVIIKVIRASTNPRTFQRALLVVSELARLIPQTVLHNIVPIFTFMGASDFQRDDSYTFGVVEQTIERILPVMTSSLKDKFTDTQELRVESLPLISIFTDMAGRLPRHRLLPFFTHLLKSLGAEFVPVVAVLLVDRTTSKKGRSGQTAAQAMELPLQILEPRGADDKLACVQVAIDEIGLLLSDIGQTDVKEALLNHLSSEGDDRTIKQVSALLTFATSLARSIIGKPVDQSVVQDVVRQLLVLTGSTSKEVKESSKIGEHLTNALQTVLRLLAVDHFLAVVSDILEGGKTQEVRMALRTLIQRLPFIKPDHRTKSTAAMSKIIARSSQLLVQADSKSETVSTVIELLSAIVPGAIAGEESALGSAIPAIIKTTPSMRSSTQLASLGLLEAAARRLGPRMIPSIKPLIELSAELAVPEDNPRPVIKQAYAVVTALLETVSQFMSSPVLFSAIVIAVGATEAEKDAARPVFAATTKHVGTKQLFEAVSGSLWAFVKDSTTPHVLENYFYLLRQSLRHADAKVLPNMIKPIFALFLDVLDLRHRLSSQSADSAVIERVEESAIGSFLELVTKLNDQTFKPLFGRLYDWAVVELAEGRPMDDTRLCQRRAVLLHVMAGLLHKFKHLVSPYLATLLPHMQELLDAFSAGALKDQDLWRLLLSTLGRSFEVDQQTFYTDSTLLTLIPALVAQIPLFPAPTFSPTPGSASASASPVAEALASLAGSTTSEPVLKQLNAAVCLITRSDDARTRLAALAVLERVWERNAEEMIPFVPETVSEFLAELLEDENSDVERGARRVLAKIEKVTGSLQEYLE